MKLFMSTPNARPAQRGYHGAICASTLTHTLLTWVYSRIAQEEVFGPFVTVLTFKDDDEALRIANGTEYGLGSGLWTRDLQRAHKVARELHAGMVWINSYKRVNPGSPFGGVGQSGYGREMGFDAMREYTQVKSVWVNVDAQIAPWYPR
jgi:acyl-CoA reductase-like NAD-dependent aldehyde dehydrogenase